MGASGLLDELSKIYDLLSITDGEIIKFFVLPDEVNTFISLLMQRCSTYNQNYYEFCYRNNIIPESQCRIFVKKDKMGLCYLQIIGHDNRTQIIVYHNKYGDCFPDPCIGYKMSEEDFKEQLEEYEQSLLRNVPKRFLKEDIPPLDLVEEFDAKKLVKYYSYLKFDYLQPETKIAFYDEPQDYLIRYNNGNKLTISSERKNEIIEYELRRRMILEHLPIYILKVVGKNSKVAREAFIFERDNNVLLVIEPESGTGYRYDVNLGPVDINDEEGLYQKVVEILEKKEEDILADVSIIRKSHTSVATFKESLDVFLKGEKNLSMYYYKVKRQQEHYKGQHL